MLKKTLISGLMAAMVLSMSACGSSGKQEASRTKDVKTESTRKETVQNENAQNENIQTEVIPEIDPIKMAMKEADVPAEIPYFEATDEIKNASMHQFKLQIADMVFDTFSKVSDCMEEFENSELPFTYEYNPDKLIPMKDSGFSGDIIIDVYLNDKLYIQLYTINAPQTAGDRETRALKDCVVYGMDLKDYSNVYYAGGIPAMDSGLSLKEFDELMLEDFNEFFGDMADRAELLNSPDTYTILYKTRKRYNTSTGGNYIFECNGAANVATGYYYEAVFDETGTNLDLLALKHDYFSYYKFQNDGVYEDDIIIER